MINRLLQRRRSCGGGPAPEAVGTVAGQVAFAPTERRLRCRGCRATTLGADQQQHHPGQLGAPDPPFAHVMPLKFINPWRIMVPDGYSVLFQPVMNRPDLPFYCFSGLVDCDRFATTINFPFIWTGGAQEITLPAGTPIVQIIPVRRDTLIKSHGARASTQGELAGQEEAKRRKYTEESTYRKDWRVKK